VAFGLSLKEGEGRASVEDPSKLTSFALPFTLPPSLRQVDPWQKSFVQGAVGSASGPGWWVNGEEVFRMES